MRAGFRRKSRRRSSPWKAGRWFHSLRQGLHPQRSRNRTRRKNLPGEFLRSRKFQRDWKRKFRRQSERRFLRRGQELFLLLSRHRRKRDRNRKKNSHRKLL